MAKVHKRGAPVLLGTFSTSGTDSGVDCTRDIARGAGRYRLVDRRSSSGVPSLTCWDLDRDPSLF